MSNYYYYFFHVDAYYNDVDFTEPGTGAQMLGETLRWALEEMDDLPTVSRLDVPVDHHAQDFVQIVGVSGGWLDAEELLAQINQSVRDTGASSWTVTLRDCLDLTTDPWTVTLRDSWDLTTEPRALSEPR